jgi:hypothetical protein
VLSAPRSPRQLARRPQRTLLASPLRQAALELHEENVRSTSVIEDGGILFGGQAKGENPSSRVSGQIVQRFVPLDKSCPVGLGCHYWTAVWVLVHISIAMLPGGLCELIFERSCGGVVAGKSLCE